MTKIEPQNMSAQLHYAGRGNPPNSQPVSAISNCFPGLEMDFRAIWRRILVGIVLIENNNYVIDAEDPRYNELKGHRLLLIDGMPTVVSTTGITNPNYPDVKLANAGNPNSVSFMEWSNSLARILSKQGQTVRCGFTTEPSDPQVLVPDNTTQLLYRDLEVRKFFEATMVEGKPTKQPVIARELAKPGELTQGLCSPWQNDYRECACYYWAASRPDYVNVTETADGASTGDNWMAKKNSGHYILDNRSDPRLVSYDDLFRDWQGALKFVIGGRNDADKEER